MIEFIADILSDRCQIKPEQKLIVAVSGGVDSLCLLDILDRLKFNIIVAHFDHTLRPESAQEAEKVRIISRKRNRRFILGRGDVFNYADQKKQTIEEASRHARYRFLIETAKNHNADAIAVGHNADDQVETILMHLLRGSGMDGLTGMTYRSLPNEWSREIAIVRPLLGIWREQLETYINEHNLQPALDPSNTDTKFFRNRIRTELVPYLEDYNPNIKKLIVQLGDTVYEDLQQIEEIIDKAWVECISDCGSGYIGFNYELLYKQSLGVQRRLIRRTIQILRPKLRDFDFRTVSNAVEFIRTPPRNRSIDLISGLKMSVELDHLWIYDQSARLPAESQPQLAENLKLELEIPGTLILQNNWKINFLVTDLLEECIEYVKRKNDLNNICLDLDKLDLPLTVRSRNPGDLIRPIGMRGHKVKLSDLFVNKKIPRRFRDLWPVVCSGLEIVWVPGLHMSQDFQVNGNTKRVVQISVSR